MIQKNGSRTAGRHFLLEPYHVFIKISSSFENICTIFVQIVSKELDSRNRLLPIITCKRQYPLVWISRDIHTNEYSRDNIGRHLTKGCVLMGYKTAFIRFMRRLQSHWFYTRLITRFYCARRVKCVTVKYTYAL